MLKQLAAVCLTLTAGAGAVWFAMQSSAGDSTNNNDFLAAGTATDGIEHDDGLDSTFSTKPGFPPSLKRGCLKADGQSNLWCPGDDGYGCYKIPTLIHAVSSKAKKLATKAKEAAKQAAVAKKSAAAAVAEKVEIEAKIVSAIDAKQAALEKALSK